MITLYKRNNKGIPIEWSIRHDNTTMIITHGLVSGNKFSQRIPITAKTKNEIESRITAKRKEGYKELCELKDNNGSLNLNINNTKDLLSYLNTYLPKYSTTSEGFVLPMLAKVLEDNKPFDKHGSFLGQYKINGLRCLIGCEKTQNDLFNPIHLTYHSRTGENWTDKISWMDEILLPKLDDVIIDIMIEEGAYLDGELYLPGYSVNDINSFVKNTSVPQHIMLQYWCYDLCVENYTVQSRNELRHTYCCGVNINFNTKENHLNNKNQFLLLNDYDVYDFEDAIYHRNKFIDLGFEGLIIRNPNSEYQFGKRNQSMFKFKKIDDGKFIIIDIKSEHKRSDLPLFILRNDINDELFECSINKSQNEQREILINKDKYVGKYMFVEYRERSGKSKVPFHARGIYIES